MSALALRMDAQTPRWAFESPRSTSEANGIYFATDRGIRCDGRDEGQVLSALFGSIPSGAAVVLPIGTCAISATLKLGDGLPTMNSTRQHLRLYGAGPGHNEAQLGPVSAATKIQWVGGRANAVIEVNGPISAVEIEGLYIDAGANPDYAIDLRHTFSSTLRRLHARGGRQGAVRLSSTAAGRSGVAVGAGSNVVDQVQTMVIAPGAAGFVLGADDQDSVGSSHNVFRHSSVLCSTSIGTVGYLLRFTDYVTFEMPTSLYCGESMRFQEQARGAARTAFPTAIYVNQAAFDRTPTWSPNWDPWPNTGAVFTNYHREWAGWPPALDAGYGPTFPVHRAIRGTDNLGRSYGKTPISQ